MLEHDYSHLHAARRHIARQRGNRPTPAQSAWRVLRVALPIIAAVYLVLGVTIWALTR